VQRLSLKNASFFRKPWFRIMLGVLALIALFLICLPIGFKKGLQYWLLQNGAEKAVIENVSINPFTGHLTIRGMEVSREGKNVLVHSRIDLDIGLVNLLHKKFRVEKAYYENVALDLEQQHNGRWRITSYTLPEKGQDKIPPENETPSSWNFLADEMHFTDCQVHLVTPKVDTTLVIASAELKNFSTLPTGGAGILNFKGTINEAPVELAIDTIIVAPNRTLGGTIKASNLKLKLLAKLLADLFPSFSGTGETEGRFLIELSATEDLTAKFNGRVALADFAVGNADFSAKGKELSWENATTLQSGPSSKSIIDTDGSLSGKDLVLHLPEAAASITGDAVQLKGPTHVDLGPKLQINSNAGLNLSGATIALPMGTITDNTFQWQGKIHYVASSAQQATVNLEGGLASKDFSLTLPEQNLQINQRALDLQLNGGVTLAKEMSLKGKGKVQAEKFHMQDSRQALPLVALEKFTTDFDAAGKANLSAQLTQFNGLTVHIPGDMPLAVTIPKIAVTAFEGKNLATYAAQSITLQALVATSIRNNQELARLAEITIDRPQFRLDQGGAANALVMKDLSFLQSAEKKTKPSALHLGRAHLSDLSWNTETGLQGKALTLNDLFCSLTREKDGQLDLQKQLAAMQAATKGTKDTTKQPSPSEIAATDTSSAGDFALKSISVQGKSGMHFEDRALAVPFISDMDIKTLEISDLSSHRPDQPAKIQFLATLERRAPLAIKGTIKPFQAAPDVKSTITLKNYPLSRLSSYTVQSVGLALASGQLNLTSSLAVAKKKIDMKNTVLLKKLQTKTLSKKLAKELDNQLPIPLETAISLLKDSDDNIKLNIPLKGPIASMNVGISDILITALSKAIVPAASSYLMYALGPYGALAYVGMKVGENIMRASLAPVSFQLRQTTLTPEHMDYLKKVAKILKERPKMEINLCPISTKAELSAAAGTKENTKKDAKIEDADRKKLRQLGQERAQKIIDYLVSTYGVNTERLFICETRIATERNASPLVNLQL
jgi:outer membrane protein OmpA-like peptidoglycan-associated protein